MEASSVTVIFYSKFGRKYGICYILKHHGGYMGTLLLCSSTMLLKIFYDLFTNPSVDGSIRIII